MFKFFQDIFNRQPSKSNSDKGQLVIPTRQTQPTVNVPRSQPSAAFLNDFPPNPKFDNPELFFAAFPPVHSTPPACEPENNGASLGK
jgi:hypothetical protein